MKRNGWFSWMTMAGALALLMIGARADAAPWQGPQRESMREELQETIEIYMIARMRRSLEMDEDQAQTIIPLMEQLNSSRRDFNKRRRLAVMRLRPLMEERPEDQSAIAETLDELYAIEREHHELEATIQTEIRASLSPIQQARFLFFQERFRREMQDRLQRIQGGNRPGPGRRGDMPNRRRPRL